MNDRLGDIRERRQEKESSTLYYFTRTPETTIVPGEVNQPQKLNIRHATELHAIFTVFVGRIFFSFFKFLDRHHRQQDDASIARFHRSLFFIFFIRKTRICATKQKDRCSFEIISERFVWRDAG